MKLHHGMFNFFIQSSFKYLWKKVIFFSTTLLVVTQWDHAMVKGMSVATSGGAAMWISP